MTDLVSLKTRQASDGDHHLHPFTDFRELREQGSRIISSARGCYIHDEQYGELLDGMSGLWCCNLGYTQPTITEAVTRQLKILPYYNNFFQCSNVPATELAARLADIAPDHINNVFFTNSGSEGNDTVLRIVNRYWALQEQPQKRYIISRKNAYHGSTIAAATLGGMSFMHKQFQTIPNVVHIDQPYWFGEGGDLSPEEFGIRAAQALEEEILELGEENVAAFIAEPIQGAGGVIIAPDSYWPEIKRILEKYDILFISDEVICGFGRTGKWFGFEHYSMKPDMINFAKAVTNGFQPLGGVMIADRITDVIKSKGGEFGHGFTCSGHPAACAAALATLDIIHNEGVIERVANDIGPYFKQQLETLADHVLVGEVRSLGMVAAIELVEDKAGRSRFDEDKGAGALCRDASIKHGLVMRATGDTMIIAPPLIMSEQQVDELVTKARKALDDTARALGV
jgi:putrescine aminotransferase